MTEHSELSIMMNTGSELFLFSIPKSIYRWFVEKREIVNALRIAVKKVCLIHYCGIPPKVRILRFLPYGNTVVSQDEICFSMKEVRDAWKCLNVKFSPRFSEDSFFDGLELTGAQYLALLCCRELSFVIQMRIVFGEDEYLLQYWKDVLGFSHNNKIFTDPSPDNVLWYEIYKVLKFCSDSLVNLFLDKSRSSS